MRPPPKQMKENFLLKMIDNFFCVIKCTEKKKLMGEFRVWCRGGFFGKCDFCDSKTMTEAEEKNAYFKT